MRATCTVLALALVTGCASAPRPPARTTCTDLGWIFQVIASYAESGRTQNDQYLWANREIDPPETRITALRIISYVYSDDRSARELGLDVARSCRLDGDLAVVSLAR